MVKIFLLIIVILGSCVLCEALRCCECFNGKTIDVSYRECMDNNTCKWTCKVSQRCGPSLFLDPSAKEGPPNVTSDYLYFDQRQGETIKMPCKIRSNPEANVTWLFNGKDISSYSNGMSQVMRTQNIMGDCSSVLEVIAQTSGRFTCLFQNAKGSRNYTFGVDVIPKQVVSPEVDDLSVDTPDHKAYLGTTFNLSCRVSFPPVESLPQINFVRHGHKVQDIEGKYENFPAKKKGISRTRKLSLKNVTFEEEGNWSCYGTQLGIKGKVKDYYLEIVPCPAGYYCPLNESTKHECPYGTYSNGLKNITYQCTKCPGRYSSTKPKGYSGPAKSIQECPAKVSAKPSLPRTPLIVSISVISIIVVIVVIFVIKFKKQCKQLLLKTISVNNLVSEHQLVINDFSAYDSEQRLFSSDPESPEFPILYDVFISYSGKDATFATEIQIELERQDFKCCIHIRDFTPGDTILNNISNAIYGSRVTLAILSPDFVESEWCKGELQQALTRSMRDHRVIPILYKNCQIPRELLHRTYIDYENCYVKPYFWEQLIKVLNPMRSAQESNA